MLRAKTEQQLCNRMWCHNSVDHRYTKQVLGAIGVVPPPSPPPCWWHNRPPAAPPPLKYTSSCLKDQRLSTKGKIVSKYCNISKTPERGSILPSPRPCTTVGVWICVYVRGLIMICYSFKIIQSLIKKIKIKKIKNKKNESMLFWPPLFMLSSLFYGFLSAAANSGFKRCLV